MKGIVVEIATLINAPAHHTTRATPDTLRSGTSSSSIIGIRSTFTMGNNWYIALLTTLAFNKGCFSTTLSLKVLVLLSASRYTAL